MREKQQQPQKIYPLKEETPAKSVAGALVITEFTNRNDADASGTSHRPSLDEPSHNSRANPNLGEPSRRAIHHANLRAIRHANHLASTLG